MHGGRINGRVRELPESWGRRDYSISLLTANRTKQTHSGKVCTEAACSQMIPSDFLPKMYSGLWTFFFSSFFHAMPISTSLSQSAAADAMLQSRTKWKRCSKDFLLSATWRRAKRPAGADREQLRRCSRESTHQQKSGSPPPAWVSVCVCVRLVSTDWQQSECRTRGSMDGAQVNKTLILISRHRPPVS